MVAEREQKKSYKKLNVDVREEECDIATCEVCNWMMICNTHCGEL